MLIGLDASRREAQQTLRAALDALAPLGEQTQALEALAMFVVERNV
jgi:geranylgeranyl pyrophosphate synthase